MKKIIPFILVVLPLFLWAQEPAYKAFQFDDTPFTPTKELEAEKEIILIQHTQVEYIAEGNQSNEILSYYSKKYINSQEAIEYNNKTYIPLNKGVNLLDVQLRVTHKNGKVTTLNEKSIEKEHNSQTGVDYNYFPIDGLEIGAVIDLHYVLKGPADVTGRIFLMQGESYIQRRSIELIYPNHLKFISRSYNGAATLTEDKETYSDRIALVGVNTNVPGIANDESYSNWHKNIQYIHTRFYNNVHASTADPYGEKEFTARAHANLHRDLDKNEQKALAAFVKSIRKESDALAQIRAIESVVKTTIQHNSYIESSSITEVLRSKQGTLNDLTTLYINLFNAFEIPYEIVFTANAYRYPFDPKFVSYLSLNDVLFYFPTSKGYMDPTTMHTRTPVIDLTYHDQYGLFIQNKLYAGVKMGISDFKKIELPYFFSKDLADIHVDLSQLERPIVRTHITFTGDMAYSSQAYLYFSSPREREQIEKDLFKSYNIQTDFITATVKNIDVERIGLDPFIVEASYLATDLLKKAGGNYIFEIGAVIGKQMEFYSDKPRKLPIQLNAARSYERTITLELPQGYRIKNIEDLDKAYYLDPENKTLAYFTITHDKKDNTITIKNLEGYNFVELPVTYWDQYRHIINAAADFNKFAIILEKQ